MNLRTFFGGGWGASLNVHGASKKRLPPLGGATPSSRLKPAENGARFENGSRFGQVLARLDKFGQFFEKIPTKC